MKEDDPLRAMWTVEGIILPSGRLCTDLRDIDEPCILETVKETGEPVAVTITRADCEALVATVRQESLPHICTRWCTPPNHAEVHAYGSCTKTSDVKVMEQRNARVLRRTVERIELTTGVMRPTVLAVVFFHGGEL